MSWRHDKTRYSDVRYSDVITLSYETMVAGTFHWLFKKVMLNQEHNMKLYYTGSDFIKK